MHSLSSKSSSELAVRPCHRIVVGRSSALHFTCSSGHTAADQRTPNCSTASQRNNNSCNGAGHSKHHSRNKNLSNRKRLSHAVLYPTTASEQLQPTADVLATEQLPFTLHQLHAFKTLAATGNKQQTADILGVTVTNISMMLNKLEKDFDEQLLIRSKGAPVQLTPAGQLLLRYTERMLSLCNDALTAAKDIQDIKSGTVTVGASQTTGVYIMPKLIEKFKREHAEVGVHLVVENTRRCCQAVTQGELDFAVVGGKIPQDLQHLLLVTNFKDDEVVLVCSKDHALHDCRHVTKTQLRQLKYVSLFQSSTVKAIRKTLEANHIQWQSLQVVLEVNSVEAIKSAVACNLGVAFVSRLAVQKELDAGLLHALQLEGIPLTRSLRCVADPTRYQSRAVRAFVDLMFGSAGFTAEELPTPFEAEEIGCCSGKKVTTTERYPALCGRGPLPSDLSLQKWGMTLAASSSNGNGVSSSVSSNGSSPHQQPQQQRPQQQQQQTLRHAALPTSVVVAPEVKVPFSLSQVAVFVVVARTGSPTSASQACSISQPAVSKSLTGLDQALGGRLVFKSSKSGPAMLTGAGQAVLPYCQQLLEVAQEACRAMHHFRLASTGVVSLGASQTVGTYLMPRLIAAFKKNNPEVVVQLAVDKSRNVCQSVAKGEVDVAIIGGDVPEDLQDVLQAVPYAQDELVLLVPSGHELAQKGSIDKCELYNLDFVSLNQGSTVQTAQEETLREQGIKWHKLRTVMELNSIEAIKGAVQHGLGAAFVSVTAIEKELELGLACRISINGVKLSRTLSLVSNPRREYPRIARKFMVQVFGMANLEPGFRQRPKQGPNAAPLRHALPAARPWEQSLSSNAAGPSKPILQQVQYIRSQSI